MKIGIKQIGTLCASVTSYGNQYCYMVLYYYMELVTLECCM